MKHEKVNQMLNAPDITGQEIGYKNYNPFIFSLNTLLDETLQIGRLMFLDVTKLEAYYINLENIFSKYHVYFIDSDKIRSELDAIEKFLYSERFLTELSYFKRTAGKKVFSPMMQRNIRLCRKKMLNIFNEMNKLFSDNGLTPTPEKKEKELWEEEGDRSLRERKKAVLDVVFGDEVKKIK